MRQIKYDGTNNFASFKSFRQKRVGSPKRRAQ
jgi:hypothetical protein